MPETIHGIPSNAMNNWMEALGSLDSTPAPETPAATPAAEAPAEETAEPAAETPKTPQDAPKQESEVATPKPAETKPEAKPEAKVEPKTDDEGMPRKNADWQKWKANRKEAEEKLKTALAEKEKALAELTAKLTEKKPVETPPEWQLEKAELEKLRKENEEYSKQLQVLEVTSHPKFKTYFDGKVKSQIEAAKNIVGPDRAADFERILNWPDSEYKTQKIEEVLAELPVLQQSRIGGILNKLDEINAERITAIEESKTNAEKLRMERETAVKRTAEENEKLFKDIIAEAQDKERGLAIYQPREGDTEWNNGVNERIQAVKSLLSAKDIKPQEVVKAALQAVAFPAILQQYQSHMQQSQAEIAKLQEQVKALSAAQPKGGKSVQTESAVPQRPDYSKLNPMQAAEAWMKSLQD